MGIKLREVKQMVNCKNGKHVKSTKFWVFDEIEETTESKAAVRKAMTEDGYIEGLEWGFNIEAVIQDE